TRPPPAGTIGRRRTASKRGHEFQAHPPTTRDRARAWRGLCPSLRRRAGRHDILAAMTAFVTAPAGFLLAVLWFDLMFDVQVLRHRGRESLPEEVLASIGGYYRRVTAL